MIMPKNRALSPAKILEKLDRWGTVLLIFLIPWQARIILRQGYLAGAPSEPRTVSIRFPVSAAMSRTAWMRRMAASPRLTMATRLNTG